jgi:hypothetical protein
MTLMGITGYRTVIYKSLHWSEAEGLLTARRIYQPASLNKPLPASIPSFPAASSFSIQGVKKTAPLEAPAFTET